MNVKLLFLEVREGAHMFWWLHYTTADTTTPTDRPLILWVCEQDYEI